MNSEPITIDTVKKNDCLFIYFEKHGGIECKVQAVLRKKVKLRVTYQIPAMRTPQVAELPLGCFARTKAEAEERFAVAKAKKDAERVAEIAKRVTDIDPETT